jgi:hypothetical protein
MVFLILLAKAKESSSEAEAPIGQNSYNYDERVNLKTMAIRGDLLFNLCSELWHSPFSQSFSLAWEGREKQAETSSLELVCLKQNTFGMRGQCLINNHQSSYGGTVK